MFATIGFYINLISQFTNPVKVILSALGVAAVAAVIMILLLIFLRKKIMVKRAYPAMRFLPVLYFVTLPLLTAFFGFKWGLIRAVHSDLETHLTAYTQPMDALLQANIDKMGVVSEFVNSNMSANQLIDSLSDRIYAEYGQTLYEESMRSEDMSSKVSGLLYKITKGRMVAAGLKQAIHKMAHDYILLDDATTKELMNERMAKLLRSGLFTHIVHLQLENFFGKAARSVAILYFIILLIPLTEIVIAHVLYSKRMQRQASLPA